MKRPGVLCLFVLVALCGAALVACVEEEAPSTPPPSPSGTAKRTPTLTATGTPVSTVTPSGTPTPLATPTPAVTPPDCPSPSQPFLIEPGESFEKAMKLHEATRIRAEATWEIGPSQLVLLLNGPDRPDQANPEAPYERREGPSGVLILDYSVTGADIERGSDWRVRVSNFESQAAAGCLTVEETPLSVESPTAVPYSPSGVYRVTYTKTADSCETFPKEFEDSLDIRVEGGAIAIHQESTGDDSAGTIDRAGHFTTSGSGPTHLETYTGRLEQGRIEAVDSFVMLGCTVEYKISGKRQ